MNHLDLFSGIGGFSLGLKRVFDIKHTYFSEIDKYAIDVYKHNFKNSTYVGTITDVRGKELPRINIITFGSPCQDFSLAGKRKGMDGEKSSLILEAIRLIKECKPDFFIWENVKGTFSSNTGADFTAILKAFVDIGGYRLEWQLLNTKWFLPQNRERIYLVGCFGKGSGQQIFPIGESYKGNFKERESSSCITTSYHKGVNFDNQLISQKVIKAVQLGNSKDFKNCTREGDAYTIRSSRLGVGVEINKKTRRLTPIECERLQGFPDDWTKKGKELGTISDTQRYKMCGNAVTVDVVEAVANKIKNAL